MSFLLAAIESLKPIWSISEIFRYSGGCSWLGILNIIKHKGKDWLTHINSITNLADQKGNIHFLYSLHMALLPR